MSLSSWSSEDDVASASRVNFVPIYDAAPDT